MNHIIFISGKAACGKSTLAKQYQEKGYYLISLDEIIRTDLAKEMKEEVDSEFNGDYTHLYRVYNNTDECGKIIEKARFILIKICREIIEQNDKVVIEGSLYHNPTLRKIVGESFTFYFVRPKDLSTYLERLELRFSEDPDNYGRIGFLGKADLKCEGLNDFKKNGIKGEIIQNLIKTAGKESFEKIDDTVKNYKKEFEKIIFLYN